jgi:hypothetical protein
MLSADKLSKDIELLRHGGSEGIALFMSTAKELLASGGEDALESWLVIATPALPERERAVVLMALFSSLFGKDCFALSDQIPPHTTLH